VAIAEVGQLVASRMLSKTFASELHRPDREEGRVRFVRKQKREVGKRDDGTHRK
jgi:hypothetical protein